MSVVNTKGAVIIATVRYISLLKRFLTRMHDSNHCGIRVFYDPQHFQTFIFTLVTFVSGQYAFSTSVTTVIWQKQLHVAAGLMQSCLAFAGH